MFIVVLLHRSLPVTFLRCIVLLLIFFMNKSKEDQPFNSSTQKEAIVEPIKAPTFTTLAWFNCVYSS